MTGWVNGLAEWIEGQTAYLSIRVHVAVTRCTSTGDLSRGVRLTRSCWWPGIVHPAALPG